MFHKITEATVTINASKEEKISADLPVFYNPAMKFNRDMSILLLKAIDNNDMQVCDLLAGSGIRAIRFLAELNPKKIKSITINDYDKGSIDIIEKNLKLNRPGFANRTATINVTNKEGRMLLHEATGFDYIDIDPFGTPNPFLDAAVRRISREGILAVTATDTAALAGSFPKACKRKYWATPDKGPTKHESGLRILIRKVQLIAAQYDKALTPIYSYSKEHYMRVFFRCSKGKAKVDELLKQHGTFNSAGPMWLGQLWEPKLADKIAKLAHGLEYETDLKFLDTIKEESNIKTVGFHDLHNLCKKSRISVPKFEMIFERVAKKHKLARTHFSDYGIRSDISEETLVKFLKQK